jgi:predicted metal-dependent phosphoesterase TrpH
VTVASTISPDAPIDFQLHTIHSDGWWHPEELIDYLVQEGFAIAAITDHDRVDTIEQVQYLGAQRNLHILTAAEFSGEWKGISTDVLCFGFDPHNPALRELSDSLLRPLYMRTRQAYMTLLERGYRFPREQELLAKRGGEVRLPTDLGLLLIKHGYVADKAEGRRLLDELNCVWSTVPVEQVIETVHQSGGVCLLAHPGRGGASFYFTEEALDELRAIAPFDGLEAFYPAHSPEDTAFFLRYAEKHQLLVSAGSDSHSPAAQMPIKYQARQARALLERLGFTFNAE